MITIGDCVQMMAGMPAGSVDAIVCDPPYGLEFMGKEWDRLGDRRQPGDATFTDVDNPYGRGKVRYGYAQDASAAGRAMQAWHEAWAREALRVLKPGGHLLAFGGTRTYHRLACAIEDAGFEIRDCLAWMYGSGFPKSHNLPNGWGTALKPAHEPIVLARKSLTGTVAGNVQAHGTGALNIDGCRIEGAPRLTGTVNPHAVSGVNGIYGSDSRTDRQQRYDADPPSGRWPANVILDQDAAAMLDQQTGDLPSNAEPSSATHLARSDVTVGWNGEKRALSNYGGGAGGASRFYYVPKASSAERNAGLDGFEAQTVQTVQSGCAGDMPTDDQGNDRDRLKVTQRNVHPTVKPINLMRWLCRLVTPPGGTVLDPFCGSGTTGIAATLEHFQFTGIERDPEYARIAEARIAWWAAHPDGMELVHRLDLERAAAATREAGQLDLFGG